MNKLFLTSNKNCKACDLLFELWELRPRNDDQKYVYWLLTELFMELHNGKDYCDGEKNE